ncbi:MAG TPA: isochorismate synthase [Nitrososphaerales archaeon]|nr:isochorismate synthase [Nitrososphaerales archaeon]
MPPRRSASALSFAEPLQRSALQGWVDRSLAEGLSEARSRGAAVLHISARRVNWDLPLGVFDSSIEDAQFFGGPERAVLGVGAAKAFDLGPPERMGSRARRSLLRLGAVSAADASKVMVIGGWGFPSSRGQSEERVWRNFPASRWVIPAFTLASSGRETHLTLVAHVKPSSQAGPLRAVYRALISRLERSAGIVGDRSDGALPTLKTARSIPSGRRWVSLARKAVEDISRGDLRKVVLSRAVSLRFTGRLPASAVLKRLITLNPDSTVFAIKRRGSVFLGATPESLLSLRSGEVKVDCLAASSPRTSDKSTDDALGARLLRDTKSSREHQFVVQAAVSALSPISSTVEVPGAPVLKRLTTIQHLYTPVKASLFEGEDVWAAATALWPTPAIGGVPNERAVRWLGKSEVARRGWYSGVVGLMNARQTEADFVVGIRSGVINGAQAVVYAGAGIVAGSDPHEELEETDWKLRTMERALGVDADGGG